MRAPSRSTTCSAFVLRRCPHIPVIVSAIQVRCTNQHYPRYVTETEHRIDVISVTAGLVQTALYLDFFYVYFTKCVLSLRARVFAAILMGFVLYRVLQGQKFELPA